MSASFPLIVITVEQFKQSLALCIGIIAINIGTPGSKKISENFRDATLQIESHDKTLKGKK